MKFPTYKPLLLLASLYLAMGSAHAEDIDIYAGAGANAALPNVLFVFDNAAAFSASVGGFTCTYPASVGGGAPSLNGTAAGIQQCALVSAIASIPDDTVNIGLMVYNENQMSGSPVVLAGTGASTTLSCGNGTGGCLVQPLAAMNATAKTRLIDFIKSWKDSGTSTTGSFNIKSNTTRTGAVMQEAWAYYAGRTGLSTVNYSGIQPPVGCQQNYVIFIGNAVGTAGSPGDGSGSNVDGSLASAPGVTATQLQPITATYGQGNTCNTSNPYYSMPNHTVPSGLWADEWARYMKGSDLYSNVAGTQDITTYTIGVLDPATCKADFPALLTSMANVGGGDYYATTDYSSLAIAIAEILNKIQAVNSAFASASLPISVNTQGTFLNQIYMGMFRPDPDGKPRWLGNLKQYQFAADTSPPNSVLSPRIFLADANGNEAISSAADSGFIAVDAVSFWSSKNTATLPDNIGGFWVKNPQGFSLGFDSPDGNIVEKGGVSQQIRLESLTTNYTTSPSGPRRLYTCVGANCAAGAGNSLSTMAFATNNNDLTGTVLGTASGAMTISSISRSGNTATATLAAAASPALTNGQSVTIAGSQYQGFNGTYAIGGVTPTTFTYTITTSPPTPSTGSFSASSPSSPQTITSLSRSGTTVTANVAGHGYSAGQGVTITGAPSGYNGTFTIGTAATNSFTYTITDGPVTPSTAAGTATVGAGAALTIPAGNIVRAASNSSNVSVVTVTVDSKHSYTVGNTVVINGVTPVEYNGSWPITALGNKCPSGKNNVSFCFNINTTPASPVVTGGMQVDASATVVAITGITRATTVCPGGTALVTATTAGHTFGNGQTVNIGGTPGANESAYTGSFTISGVTATTFQYTINTSPGCTDNTTGMTAAVSGSIDRETLINWVRGKDSLGDEPSPGNGITIRPSVHGEVLHSRPAVIAYGTTPDVVVFYGSNDGVFRAINGNKTGSIGGVPPGGELWGFIPQEFYTKLQRQYTNSPIIKLHNTSNAIVPTPQPKDYFFDGGIGVYQDATVTPNQAYIFLSARRGGRIIYAFDVSDPTDPKFMWKRSNTDTDTAFSELGQTWSQPKPARVKGHPNPVLIFGAGYDTNQDLEPPGTDTMGRGIFILDALDGSIVWRAGPGGAGTTCKGNPCLLSNMTYSIPSDVTLVDRNPDGFIDRLYAADVGGNVWRVDLEPGSGNTPANWQVTKLASLGGTATTKRKIFFPPDVVTTKNFDAVLVGTGDREHPVYSNSSINIVNRFYMLKDLNTGSDACPSGSCATTIVDDTDPTWPGTTGNTAQLFDATTTVYDNSLNGFFIQLLNLVTNTDGTQGPGYEKGEKVVNAPTTVGGRTFFGTNTPIAPDPSVCSANLGVARGYSFDVVTGESSFVVFRGGGLPPSPVTGLVTVDVDGTPTLIPFLIGGGSPEPCTGPDCTSALGGIKPPIPITPTRTRTYWYREHDK